MRATARDLRVKTREIMAAIERGEEVTITYRGKEKAKMVPIMGKESGDGGPRDHLFGIWSDNPKVKDVNGYLNQLRGGRFATG